MGILDTIKFSDFVTSANRLWECPNFGDIPEFVLIGRSNVGKSSFINAVLNRKKLAKTSNTPGKTRMINFFKITGRDNEWVFADLPGYGYAQVSNQVKLSWQSNIEEYLTQRQQLTMAFLLIDSRHGLQDSDFHMANWLIRHGIAFIPVLTKIDKIKRGELMKIEAETSDKLSFSTENIIKFSAETKAGRNHVGQVIETIIENWASSG